MLTQRARIGSKVKKNTQNSQRDISCDEAVYKPLALSPPFVHQVHRDAEFSTCFVAIVEERFFLYTVCTGFQRHCADRCQ